MKTTYRLIAILTLFGLLAGCAPAPTQAPVPTATPVLTPPTFDELIPIAKQFITDMAKGDFAAAYGRFDSGLQKTVSVEKLATAWQKMVTSGGLFQQTSTVTTRFVGGNPEVDITLEFDHGTVVALVTFNEQSRIISMTFSDMMISLPVPRIVAGPGPRTL